MVVVAFSETELACLPRKRFLLFAGVESNDCGGLALAKALSPPV